MGCYVCALLGPTGAAGGAVQPCPRGVCGCPQCAHWRAILHLCQDHPALTPDNDQQTAPLPVSCACVHTYIHAYVLYLLCVRICTSRVHYSVTSYVYDIKLSSPSAPPSLVPCPFSHSSSLHPSPFCRILSAAPTAICGLAFDLAQRLSPYLRHIDFALDWMVLEAGRSLYKYDKHTRARAHTHTHTLLHDTYSYFISPHSLAKYHDIPDVLVESKSF